MDQLTDTCICGHTRYQHVTSQGTPTDCSYTDDTENDCWCAGFKTT